ncbi:con-Ins Im1 isoform X1 [Octopus sinensis]|uniref:Con-Ins Im1 isoform X1 n=1 Tax=Octopus sinensis TaxID=2607531 RepID=A0A7E6EQL7_9MOLL|nr:con-Ins Im1 isoform X1 [Octopus sinensis]
MTPAGSMKSCNMCTTWTMLLALLISLLNWQLVIAGLEHTCNEETIRQGAASGGYCGDKIPNFLRLICSPGGYSDGPRQRRNYVSPYASRGLRHRSSTLKDIIISKKKAKSYLVKRDRNWSGIVCECCYNTCTIEELLDYCKDPRDFRARVQQS